MRAINTIFMLIPLFLLSLLASCDWHTVQDPHSETAVTENLQYTNEKDHEMPIGQIHNEVLSAIHARHDLLSGEKIHVDRFVPLLIESMNEVYEQHELPCNVDNEQIISILKVFAELRDKGVANFFEIPSEIPVPLIEHLAKEGVISKNSAEHFTQALQSIVDRASSGVKTDRRDIPVYKSAGITSEQDDLFTEMACYSSAFWTKLCFKSEKHQIYKTDDDEDDIEKQKAIMLVCWDALGGYVGTLLAGPAGAVLGVILASVAYIIFGW